MKIIPNGHRKITFFLPNCIVFNHLSFAVLKHVLKKNDPQFKKLKYKQIKPLVKTVKSYSGGEKFCFLEVRNRDNEFYMYI